MGNITRKILLLLVIGSILFVAAEGRRRRHRRHCPSRDDEDHVCCEWKTKTYQISYQQCATCTVPTPENELCWPSRHRQQYFCRYTYVRNVTKVKCEAKCCDGWTIDENGQCSVRADEQQDIVCENGGSPAGDYCSCPIGFVGTHCETAVCTPICLNNGFCGGRDGKAVCICPERNFTGEQCEIPVCDPNCQNGGSCMENGYETKCACMPGFAGQSCEKKIKDGECPYMGEVSTCQVECGDDFQCTGTKKCCINACGGGVCVYPANTTCTYKGQQYPLGHITNPSPCKTCFCSDPNSQGDKQWRCAVMDCPILTCDHRKTIPDVCCPVCDDAPTTVRPTTRISRIPTTRFPTTTRISTTRFPTTTRIPTTRFPTTTRIPTTRFPTTTRIPTTRFQTTTRIPTTRFQTTTRIPTTRFQTTTRIPTTRFQTTTRIPTTRFQTTRSSRIPTTRFPTTRISRIPTTRFQTTRISRISTTRFPTTRVSRIPTTRFPTTPKTTCQEDGQEYPVGHVISRNNYCERCTCGYDGWKCCPVCDGTPSTTPRPVQTTLSPDNAPFFKYCPKERLTLSTLGRKYVDIRAQVNLTVVDKSGKKYTVNYSQKRIAAKPCNCTDNYHIIIARSEVDKHGRFASCMFNVHVFDNNPPVYKTCPTSIAAFEDEIITWDRPKAYDNVAIKSEKFKSLHENNSKFKVGSHVVMYILTDDQGNIGICNFLVAIYERGTTDPTAPLELKNGGDKDESNLIYVVTGVLAGLIALTTTVIVLACYRRRRNKKRASGNAHPVCGYDNHIYNLIL